jgi:uncharacterized protein (TIGR02452 family)
MKRFPLAYTAKQNAQPPQTHTDSGMRRREELRRTARETLNILPEIMEQLDPSIDVCRSEKLSCHSLRRLHPSRCPTLPRRARIRVLNEDTLNAAIILSQLADDGGGTNSFLSRHDPSLRPIIINFANYRNPGGGWLNGAVAQEEAICYRSSLAKSLKKRDYPLALDEAIYSPFVLVLRDDMASGHGLFLREIPAADLPIVSAITIAAICRPRVEIVQTSKQNDGSGSSQPQEQQLFVRDKDRDTTKTKMRMALRIAAINSHRMLVLGALGCGVYGNPPDDVAYCWREVLQEEEFAGNWWREIYFAVYDPKNEGNYDTFERVLSGIEV